MHVVHGGGSKNRILDLGLQMRRFDFRCSLAMIHVVVAELDPLPFLVGKVVVCLRERVQPVTPARLLCALSPFLALKLFVSRVLWTLGHSSIVYNVRTC